MITTKDEAPAEFMERYKKIMDGEEKLDSIAKLKDFWVFAVEQGQNQSYETRAKMANLMFEAPIDSGLFNRLDIHYKGFYAELESYRIITANKDEGSDRFEQIGNAGWFMLAEMIKNLKKY